MSNRSRRRKQQARCIDKAIELMMAFVSKRLFPKEIIEKLVTISAIEETIK